MPPDRPSPDDDPGQPLERVQSANVSARVPAGVAGGVFATGVIVLQSPTEVMIDFAQGVVNPRQIGVRVVLAPSVAVQFVGALEENLGMYETTFGRRPSEPVPVPDPHADDVPREAADLAGAEPGGASGGSEGRGSDPDAGDLIGDEVDRGDSSSPPPAVPQQPVADAYSQLKASDEVLGGAYANTVTISHTGSEFHFDFINRCFPRSVVTARVYMAAPRVPALLDSLKRSLRR